MPVSDKTFNGYRYAMMNGLENITKAILDDAQAQANSILDAAKKQADEMLKNAQADAKNQEEQIYAEAEKKVNGIKDSAQSFCELDKKNELLKAKMDLIDEMFGLAIKQMCELPTDEYFNRLKYLIAANAINGDGVLIMNSKDLSRVPSGFMNLVGASLTGPKSLALSKQADDKICGGCVLKYGDIEINLGFDRIIAAQKEQLIDKVNKILFG